MADISEEREPHWLDPIIDVYKKDVDMRLIYKNLKRTPTQRLENLEAILEELDQSIRAKVAANPENAEAIAEEAIRELNTQRLKQPHRPVDLHTAPPGNS